MRKSRLTVFQILAWIDRFRSRTGKWPTRNSGEIPGTNATWSGIDLALKHGNRGLPGGSSLAILIAGRTGRYRNRLPRLSIAKILKWARAHHAATGAWPQTNSGPIAEAEGETWLAVDHALRRGTRGLRAKMSLAQLFDKHFAVKNPHSLPPLTIRGILKWADAYHRRTGKWPNRTSGAVPGTKYETWASIDNALHRGGRGLNTRTSLARILGQHRAVRSRINVPKLTTSAILRWASAYVKATGRRPTLWSGPIPNSDGETWLAVDAALKTGGRGLPGGSSLSRLLDTRAKFARLGRKRAKNRVKGKKRPGRRP